MRTFYDARASLPVPTPSSDRPLLSRSPAWAPADLHMCALERDERVVLVSFSLGRLMLLSRSEREVARWASAGSSNAAIARLRQTSVLTVARQMASLLPKLRIGARVDLARIPELNAWSPPLTIHRPGAWPRDSRLSADGIALEPHEIARIWRGIALGNWSAIATIDVAGVGYAAMTCVSAREVDWRVLRPRQRDALALAASGCAQKVIAMKLGMSPSTVSSALGRAHKRLGFGSLVQMVRAYCATRDVLDQPALRSLSSSTREGGACAPRHGRRRP